MPGSFRRVCAGAGSQSRPPADRAARRAAGSDELRTDAAHLLLDEARIVDGEPPRDPRAFAERLARLIARATA
jgi:molecular chaperone HtpG